MTFKNFGKLPGKPSALIRLALKDLAKVAKDPRYKIHMGSWHDEVNSKCSVCAAGAVMAKTLGAAINSCRRPWDYKEEKALEVINLLRHGAVRDAFFQLDLDTRVGSTFNRETSRQFKRSEMLTLAKDLEKAGY